MKIDAMERASKVCSEKLRAAQELASANVKARKALQLELDDFVAKVQSLEKKTREDAQKMITQHSMCARVEAMLEYFKGEHATWDMNETIRIYNEAYPTDAFPLYVPPSAMDEASKDGDEN